MSNPDWSQLKGMTENQAENFMLSSWGRIPSDWNDPLFRDEVLGLLGQAEITAHMNVGVQAYRQSHGADTEWIWARRNVHDQGHPQSKEVLKKMAKNKEG